LRLLEIRKREEQKRKDFRKKKRKYHAPKRSDSLAKNRYMFRDEDTRGKKGDPAGAKEEGTIWRGANRKEPKFPPWRKIMQ